MSLKLSGTQYLSRTANLPPVQAVTLCGWFKHTVDPGNAWQAFLGFGNTSGSCMLTLGQIQDSPNYRWGLYNYISSTFAYFTAQPKAGEWCFAALTNDSGNARAYFRKASAPKLEGVSLAAMSGTVNSIRAGTTVFDGTNFFLGSIADVRAWDRVLTITELLEESYSERPAYRGKLNFWWPGKNAQGAKLDQGGNVRPPTVTGTMGTDATPGNVLYRIRKPLLRRRVSPLEESGAQTITAGLFTNAQVFPAHTVTPGAVNISPALFPNAQVFPAHVISTSYTISAALFTNAQVFPAHVISTSYTISAALFTNAQTFPGHTVTPGAVTVTAGLFTNAQVFPSHTVSLASGPQTITAALFTNAQIFPAATITPGAVNVGAGLFTNAQIFPAATVSAGYTISAGLFTNAQVFPAATVTPGVVTVSMALFTNAQVFPAATVSLASGPQTITAGLFTNAQDFPAHTITGGETSQPGKAGGAGFRYDRSESRQAYRARRRVEREAVRRPDVVPYWMAHRRYEQIMDAPLPPEVKREAVAIVAPYVEPQAPAAVKAMPTPKVIDWRALQANTAAVARLLELWQREESLAAAQATFGTQDDDDMTTILLLL